ncbi:flagellar hook-basal body complex protein FliE [Nitrococcus mobilis]|uniref:Flagellar hook-basal body complex protein FliE n=1 Tax=Nitrococcus mobilis Nb-231 TaxID=314278 RepID=A4BUD4_9GAMM|nr:flagellar hook-basal body complex protein FliE [Nitrococcus mobilis]EAR20648.1 flagellar biosynthesis; basal-body component [Nitrococcus mobilis Nb-231]
MNDIRIQQALQQMQTLAAQAAGRLPSEAAVDSRPADFAGLLQSAIETVNDLQQNTGRKTDAFLNGEGVPLTEVMIAGQKSRVAFEAIKEVRNHLLTAYQEISRMQI